MIADKKNNFIFVFLLLIFFYSCGYNFTGGGDFPGAAKSVFIDFFENRTSETGLGNIITNDFIYEVTRMKKVALMSENRADTILSGVVRSMSIGSISYHESQSSSERRVVISVDLKLTDRDGRVLWFRNGISENEEYDVEGSDKYATERNRREAIEELSERLAEKIYNQMTASF